MTPPPDRTRRSGPGAGPRVPDATPDRDDTPDRDATRIVCERCGTVMFDRHCKVVCPNCGYLRDCSDP